MEMDHLAVSGAALEAATAHVTGALGVPMQRGGQHAVFFTHNTLLGLEDDLYLEAIAIDPQARQPLRPRWFDLDRFQGTPRLTNWICRVDDLDRVVDQIDLPLGKPVDLQRGDLRWRMAVPESGCLPFDNLAPALIEWQTDETPPRRLTNSGCRLLVLDLVHPEAKALQDALSPYFSDDRVRFHTGAAPSLRATFDTPLGPRVLV